jgi:hypothetical protein
VTAPLVSRPSVSGRIQSRAASSPLTQQPKVADHKDQTSRSAESQVSTVNATAVMAVPGLRSF